MSDEDAPLTAGQRYGWQEE